MEEIIQKAREGGYKPTMYKGDLYDENLVKCGFFGGYTITERDIVLDPLFWQALGKACGWKEKVCDWCGSDKLQGFACYGGQEEGRNFHAGSEVQYQPRVQISEWQYQSLRFHEINLTEGWSKAVEYLQSIIKK